MSTIDVKMNKLVERMSDGREDQIAEVISMKKTLKGALLKKNLKEHPALVQLLSTLKKREEQYTMILANKEDLNETERQAIFARRKEVRFILSFFDSADKTIESMEKQLDYQLSDEVQELSPLE